MIPLNNIYLRTLQLAVIDYLSEITITYNNNKVVRIPFVIAGSNQERFLQDFFQSDVINEALSDKYAKYFEFANQANPRGLSTMSSVNIESDNISNNFVKVERTLLNENGELKTFYSNAKLIRLNVTFENTVKFSTAFEMYSAWESLMYRLFRQHPINFIYKGMPIYGKIIMEDDINLTNTNEYNFGDEVERKIEFNFNVSTYYPLFDETTRTGVTDRMGRISLNVDNYVRDDELLFLDDTYVGTGKDTEFNGVINPGEREDGERDFVNDEVIGVNEREIQNSKQDPQIINIGFKPNGEQLQHGESDIESNITDIGAVKKTHRGHSITN